ncbi:alpha-amylase [Bdellovibrio reynosensis]|uniref:Alpha-amylase n=1 Tax=Bdellovibrio reynosensis TaxID=2835041 RepID=A0ABY4C6Z6_9BACT|nr:alpha-amylase family protein [Bdellovibrio reynosensis]UOF00663.1 alpha-amylase family protein [Bdellovibrio reynosensis]
MSFQIWARILSFLTLFCALQVQAGTRTVYIHLFEWPWKDVAQECESYLGPAGFSAVQVSPPHEHIMWQNNPWWERYQVVSYNLNSRSGNEAEFADMVRRCQKVGVDVYVDAVLNHTTGIPGGIGFGGTRFTHYDYPGLYNYNDFHHCGRNGNDNIINFNDRYELQNCELVDLADLSTSSENVRNRLAQYLNHLLDLGVAGFRIDAAKHIPSQDLAAIYSKLKRSSYIYHEVIYDPRGPVEYSEYLPYGDVMAYDYPRAISRNITQKNISGLLHLAQGFPRSEDSIVFVTNHDLERHGDAEILGFYNNRKAYRLAQIFMLAWPYGYPQLYSGYSFGSFDQGPPLTSDLKSHPVLDNGLNCLANWTCEHRMPEVAAMVNFRNQTDKAFYVNNWWTNGTDLLSFGRGGLGFVVMNLGGQTVAREFETSLPQGEYCNIVSGSYNPRTKTCSESFEVDNRGRVHATIQPMSAVVLLKTSPFKSKIK